MLGDLTSGHEPMCCLWICMSRVGEDDAMHSEELGVFSEQVAGTRVLVKHVRAGNSPMQRQ